MAETKPVVMKIQGKIERVNREATARGQNGKLRATKGLIQLKMMGENRWQLWLSLPNDLHNARYDVNTIQKMRTTFVSEGKLTMELSKPTFNILMRDCNPTHLSMFVAKLQSILKSTSEQHECLETENVGTKAELDKALEKSIPDGQQGTVKLSSQNAGERASQELLKRSANAGKEKTVVGGVKIGEKRPLNATDMSKKEASLIRKSLKLSTTNLTITDRSEYPRSKFPDDLKRLTCHKLQLHRIDIRLQVLLNLKYLSLPDNRIASLRPLINLRSRLDHLNLANNLIETIDEDVFSSKSLSQLKFLNLSGNQIKALPYTFLELPELRELNLANNYIQFLPYNMHRLTSLCSVKLNGNHLQAIPSPISLLRLMHLDISGNFLHHSANNLRRIHHVVQLKETPTLFELAGAALMTSWFRKMPQMILPDSSHLPSIILEYMKRSKYCRFCGKTVLRYSVNYQTGTSSFAQEMVRNLHDYSVCIIRCDKCAARDYV